jgi:hypothetical protein
MVFRGDEIVAHALATVVNGDGHNLSLNGVLFGEIKLLPS